MVDTETNHEGGACVQIEVESFAADSRSWNFQLLDKLAELVVAQVAQYLRDNGWPKFTLQPYADRGVGGASYGFKGQGRMSRAEWESGRRKDGKSWTLTGHNQIPWQRHWDPGALDYGRIAETANKLLKPAAVPTQPEPVKPVVITPSAPASKPEPKTEPVITQDVLDKAREKELTGIMDELVRLSGVADDLAEEIAEVYQSVGKLVAHVDD